jgi:hypothetical protein
MPVCLNEHARQGPLLPRWDRTSRDAAAAIFYSGRCQPSPASFPDAMERRVPARSTMEPCASGQGAPGRKAKPWVLTVNPARRNSRGRSCVWTGPSGTQRPEMWARWWGGAKYLDREEGAGGGVAGCGRRVTGSREWWREARRRGCWGRWGARQPSSADITFFKIIRWHVWSLIEEREGLVVTWVCYSLRFGLLVLSHS